MGAIKPCSAALYLRVIAPQGDVIHLDTSRFPIIDGGFQ
jgi:hypothetical protein